MGSLGFLPPEVHWMSTRFDLFGLRFLSEDHAATKSRIRENRQKEMELGRPDQEEDGEEEVFFSYKKRRVFEVFRSPVAALHKFMQPLRPVHGLTYWRRVSLNSQRQHCYLRGD